VEWTKKRRLAGLELTTAISHENNDMSITEYLLPVLVLRIFVNGVLLTTVRII